MISTRVIVPLILILTTFDRQGLALEDAQRDKKLFSLFSVVSFPNAQCTAKSDSTMYGTCYSASECSSKSGTADGNCASGFGVCCTFTLSSCSSTVTQNCTYITNPSYPSTYSTTGSCAYTVTPLSTDICQIRLDFSNFDITETTAGVCTDSFAISGPTGNSPPDVCGTLSSQHMYFESGRTTTATTLTFTIATGGTWKIKVSQIECSSLMRAPHDCDQYFTGLTGNALSYNWYGSVVLKNKDAVTCIRREKGYCNINYAQAQGTTIDSFTLDTAIADTTNNGAGSVATTTLSWVNIPNGILADVYSGQALSGWSAKVQKSAGLVSVTEGHRFILTHRSQAIAQTSNYGYNIVWNQVPCT